MKSFFITGTGTDIGKTTFATYICSRLGLKYFKPIETGESDTEVVRQAGVETFPPIYSLPYPISPHLSAIRSGIEIDPSLFTLPEVENLVVEGAGGVFVPITYEYFMLDLIEKFALPVVIVAKDRLGVLNEVLLTAYALSSRGISVLSIVLNSFEPNSLDNASQLKDLTGLDVFLFGADCSTLPPFVDKL